MLHEKKQSHFHDQNIIRTRDRNTGKRIFNLRKFNFYLIDYTKVFDKIFQEELIEMLLPGNALDLHINDIQIIRNLY